MHSEDPDRILLVNKPLGWTSFDVVKKIRNCLKIKKIGHAGTLDPLATGLLILCSGKMTKKIIGIQDMEKEYVGDFILGQVTPSYDLETKVEFVSDCHELKIQDIHKATEDFIGEIDQVPPVFSAIKIGGKRAYLKARKGEKIELQPRKVKITEFEITNVKLPRISVRVVCSKGTYVRSLANDFGEKLGVGAHLSKLERTRIGDYHLTNAQSIEQICAE